MTAVMVPASGAISGGGNPLARNNRGRLTLVPGQTGTLVSFVAGSHRLRGFQVWGETDGFAWLTVDSVPLDGLAAVHSVVKDAVRYLPNAEAYPSALSVVELKVQNNGPVTATFEGTVLGE